MLLTDLVVFRFMSACTLTCVTDILCAVADEQLSNMQWRHVLTDLFWYRLMSSLASRHSSVGICSVLMLMSTCTRKCSSDRCCCVQVDEHPHVEVCRKTARPWLDKAFQQTADVGAHVLRASLHTPFRPIIMIALWT